MFTLKDFSCINLTFLSFMDEFCNSFIECIIQVLNIKDAKLIVFPY